MSHVRSLTLGQAIVPARVPAAAVAVAMSWIIALLAQVEIPLPFTPVPVTGQTLGVMYAGALLGSRLGLLSVGLYLLQGAAGLPFFAGGAGGTAYLLGPTAGYLAGFLPAAYFTGRLAERGWDRDPLKAFVMMLIGSLFVFGFGLAGLSRFIPASELLAKGWLPFIPGDLFKSAVSAGLLPLGWKYLRVDRF